MDPKWKYGLAAVYAGIGAIVLLVIVAMFRYPAGDVNNVVGTSLGAIGTLVGAYFGVQVGSVGKEQAERAKDEAHEQAVKLAAVAPEEKAQAIINAA
jgi:hypothetical protein